jgi:hypothetical protein
MIISSEPERLGFELHSHSNFKQEISPQLRKPYETAWKSCLRHGELLLLDRKTPGALCQKNWYELVPGYAEYPIGSALLVALNGCDPTRRPRIRRDSLVSILPCLVLGRSGFILRTDANEQNRGHHPKTVVEVASDVKLRDHFRLADGDQVEIEIPEAAIEDQQIGSAGEPNSH